MIPPDDAGRYVPALRLGARELRRVARARFERGEFIASADLHGAALELEELRFALDHRIQEEERDGPQEPKGR